MHASTASTSDRLGAWKLVVLRVLDCNRVISTGKGASVSRLVLVFVEGLVTVVGGVNSSHSRTSGDRRRNRWAEWGFGGLGGLDATTETKCSKSSSGSTLGEHVFFFFLSRVCLGVVVRRCWGKIRR